MYNGYDIKKLTSPSDQELANLQKIYEDNFPPEERKPFELIAKGIQAGKYYAFVAVETQAEATTASVAAFAFLLLLDTAPVLFLEYIAVDKNLHSKGLGTQLFKSIESSLQQEGNITAIVWEVEPLLTDDPTDQRVRRVKFYHQLGAILITNSESYCMPDYESGGYVPLRLMWKPIGSSRTQPTTDEIVQFVDGIYRAAYSDHMHLRDQIVAELLAKKN
ncbi:MAG: GNAT family N-acetyltransferase [Anaerolineae bacterium]|nr:GNAT family N-acetyltransferase [Anaerolineae bacterium]